MSTERHGLLRPLVHAAVGLIALTLGILPRPFALLGALAAIAFNWFVLPSLPIEQRLRRADEPFLGGLRTYPVAVFGLVLLLPGPAAAAAWGVLAFGDAAAAIVGQRVPAPSLLGHGKATWSGSGAYLLVGGAAALGLSEAVAALARSCSWVAAHPAPGLAACLLAALAATLMDLLPLPIDDNLPAALAAGLTLAAFLSL